MRNVKLPTLVLAASVAGCQSWQTIVPPQPGGHLAGDPQQVVVKRQNGSEVRIYNPVVQGDSLAGFLENGRSSTRHRTALALSDISQVSSTQMDQAFTIGAAVVGSIAIAFVLAVYFLSHMGN